MGAGEEMRLGIGEERGGKPLRGGMYTPHMPASEVNGYHMLASEVKAAWGSYARECGEGSMGLKTEN